MSKEMEFHAAYQKAAVGRPEWEKELRRMRESHPLLIEALTGLLALNEKQFRMLEESVRRRMATMNPPETRFW